MASAWKEAVEAHMDFVDDLDGDHDATGNAVRISDGATFTFTRGGHRETEAILTEAGTYVLAGEQIHGYVRPTDITLVKADLVTFESRRWKVVGVYAERLIGSEELTHRVSLTALEG